MNETPQGQPGIGPLAQEAALLLDVVADRLTSLRAGDADPVADDVASGAAAAAGRCPECGALPDASCTACPLCRLLAVLRGERPEATARLVDGALMIVRTLRSLIPEPAQAPQHSHAPAAARQEPTGGRRGGLEHIDIL